jgi:hypothetical protein
MKKMFATLLSRLRRRRRCVRSVWDGLDPEHLRGWTPPGEPVITPADEAWLRKELK